MAKILVVDDNEDWRALVAHWVESAGHQAIQAPNGQVGLRECFSQHPDLLLMDVAMPVMDGWELLERVREMSETPIILLSGMVKEAEKVRGLSGGADDYVGKSIGKAELLARIDANLRRAVRPGFESEYRDAGLVVDFRTHKVSVQGEKVELSPIEYRLLSALVRSAGAVRTAEELLDEAWEDGTGGPANVRVYVSFLRKKLAVGTGPHPVIETVRSFGYRYAAPEAATV